MNKKNILYRALYAALTLVVAFGLSSCKDDDSDAPLTLYYAGISDIGPGMSFRSGTPSFQGATPSSFSITKVTLEDEVYTGDNFQIEPETGIISISNTLLISTGTYKLSISCMANGGTYTFPEIFEVFMLPSAPASIAAEPASVQIDFDGDPYEKAKTSQITLTSESISAFNYQIVTEEDDPEYFTITKTGEVGLKKLDATTYVTPPPGKYDLKIKVITRAGDATFDDVVRFDITSRPRSLTYVPASRKMEFNTTFSSEKPVMVGSDDNVAYSIKSTTPQTDQIKIDPQTGVLSVAAGNTLQIGDSFDIDVTVSNLYGNTDFEDAFNLAVVPFINPISNFSYANKTSTYLVALSHPKDAGFIGDEVIFSFGAEMDDALKRYLKIDVLTGEITAQKGNKIPEGTYTVPVVATNEKSPEGGNRTSFTLTVAENLNYFTYIRYGNNMSLAPEENYANQFFFMSQSEMQGYTIAVPQTDIKAGRPVTWSVEKLGSQNTLIDNIGIEDDGSMNLASASWGNRSWAIAIVTATVGAGTPEEFVKKVPVFFCANPTNGGVLVKYTPFVLQINPERGGSSTVPVVTGLSGAETLAIDWRRNYHYFNFNGPAEHDVYKTVSNVKVCEFIERMWSSVATQAGGSIGFSFGSGGTRGPVSYFQMKDRLSAALMYIDNNATSTNPFALVVNPGKWRDDYGWADGFFAGQMTFTKNGEDPQSGTGTYPIIVWFSTDF